MPKLKIHRNTNKSIAEKMFGMEGPNGLQLRKERDNIAMKRKIDRKMKERD